MKNIVNMDSDSVSFYERFRKLSLIEIIEILWLKITWEERLNRITKQCENRLNKLLQ